MPCGCFGKKKKDVGEELEKKAPPTNSTDLKKAKAGGAGSSVEEDAGKTAKRRDVVASYYEDECALLGYRARPPSSYVDSPTSNDSHTTHTPSTVPVVASSTASQTSSASSPSTSPSTSRAAASSRAELAEKRREFFKDFYPNGESRRSGAVSYGDDERNLPSTLPTVARARQFGKVRPMRPVSQPTTPTDSPSAVPEAPPPPGPHLLHPVAKNGSSPRMGAKEDEEEEGGGFASPEFLRELKNASTEISQRWGAATIMVSEGEEEATTPSGLKMRPVKMMQQRSSADDENVAVVVNGDETYVTTTNDSQDGSCHSHSLVESGSELGTASLDPTHNTVNVPETLVTPPSPPSVEISEHFESPPLPRSNAQPSDPGDIRSSSSSGKESPTALEAETVVPDSNAEFELISPDAAPVGVIVSDRVAAADEDNFEFDSRLVATTTEEDHERALEEDIKKMSCLRGDDDDSFDLSDEPPAWGETVVVEDVSRSRLESACSSFGVGASLSSPEGEGQKNDGVPHEQYSTTNIINSSISEDIKTPN